MISVPAGALLAVGLPLIAALAAVPSCDSADRETERPTLEPIRFTHTLRSDRLIAGADVILDLRVENHGTEPFRFPNPMFPTSPQPTYKLRRPDGTVVTFVPLIVDDSTEEPGNITFISLPPERAWIGELTLNHYADVSAEGRYDLTAVIEWNGQQVKSEKVDFEISAARFRHLAISLSRSEDGGGNAEALLLQVSESGLESVAFVLDEENNVLGEMPVDGLRSRGPVPEDAERVLGPFSNYETALDALEWMVCTTAQGIWVGNTLDLQPTLIPHPKLLAVGTPLATQDRNLFLIALTETEGHSALAFAVVEDPEAQPPQPSWKLVHEFSGVPIALGTALGPQPQGSAIVAAVAEPDGDGTRVTMLRLGPDGSVLNSIVEIVPNISVASPLALHIDTQGLLRASFVGRDTNNQGTLRLVDLECTQDLKGKIDHRVSAPFDIMPEILDIHIAYDEFVRGEVSRAVLMRREYGTAQAIIDAKPIRSVLTPIPNDDPVGLVRGLNTWYSVIARHGTVAAETL